MLSALGGLGALGDSRSDVLAQVTERPWKSKTIAHKPALQIAIPNYNPSPAMPNERDVITRTGVQPVTQTQLVNDLRRLGVQQNSTLMVHSAMSSLGWVVGGPQAVIMALREAVGPDGTLVMPAHSSEWSDPGRWENPPVPEAWWPVIRDHCPAFDPDVTPSRGVGRVAETFRTLPGTRRSAHPQVSLAAQGPRADALVADHRLPYGFGLASPYGRLYEQGAQILLLGVGYDNCSLLHLAEHQIGPPRIPACPESFAVQLDGKRSWVTVDDLDHDADRFPALGGAFEKQSSDVQIGRVGLATARLLDAAPLVDFATQWLTRHVDDRVEGTEGQG